MTKLVVIGTGYVGLPAAIGFANFGCNVLCLDIDKEKIENLNNGNIPIYETGIQQLLNENVKAGRLKFSTDIPSGIKFGDVIFIAVGTPQGDDGNADLTALFEAVKSIGENLDRYKIIVTKSTVPVGTNEKIAKLLEEYSSGNNFDVVSNPEFLREGRAMYDFLHPDRVVIGCQSERPHNTMKKIYRPLYLTEIPFVFTDLRTAEMIKYAANCFLSTKIAFINEIARLCDVVGADVKTIAKTMGKDVRIGSKFLHPSPGYGGSCFPKDTEALASFARQNSSPLTIVETVIKSNTYQKKYMVEKIKNKMGNINGKTFAVLGLAFKSETDDIRDSPAITIIEHLLEEGAFIKAYDPQAIANTKKIFKENIEYTSNEYKACENADAIVILTEWNQFRNLDLEEIKCSLNSNFFFDFRNIYNRTDLENLGFIYSGIGM